MQAPAQCTGKPKDFLQLYRAAVAPLSRDQALVQGVTQRVRGTLVMTQAEGGSSDTLQSTLPALENSDSSLCNQREGSFWSPGFPRNTSSILPLGTLQLLPP